MFENPGDKLEEAIRKLLPSVKMTPWSELMIHDFVEHDYYAIIGCGSSGKSFTLSALSICHWLPDPFDTAVIIGSSTLKDLAARSWSSTLSLFSELKNNKENVLVPGKIMTGQYAIINEKDESLPDSMGAKASIQGRALDEGRIYGTHAPWCALIVDELALISDIEALKTAITNIRIGTLGFKFVSAANPDSWDAPQSYLYTPPKGVNINENTGSWTSATGTFVRHFDGFKSPSVLDPSLRSEYPFLMNQDTIDQTILEAGGEIASPRVYKMIRGFPRPVGTSTPTVLDPIVANANDVSGALHPPFSGGRRAVSLALGVDPAYSEGGDAAVSAGVQVIEQDGKAFLDFTGRVSRIPISAASPIPVSQQLRDAVIRRIHADNGPELKNVFVDSSGNQSLADILDIYVGGGCGHINSSSRASDNPIRAHDVRKAREHIKDRGTEAWIVLAAFCEAGMVKGLPAEAVKGLTTRRFATKPGSDDIVMPLRLEPKEQFITRFKGSPNETDACALAALAVKERLGVMPFGALPAPTQSSLFPQAMQGFASLATNADNDFNNYSGTDSDDSGYGALD